MEAISNQIITLLLSSSHHLSKVQSRQKNVFRKTSNLGSMFTKNVQQTGITQSPTTLPHLNPNFQLRCTKRPQLEDAWTLYWLHGTAITGWPAGCWCSTGDATPALFCHQLTKDLQVHCKFLPCIYWASHSQNRQRN